MATNSRKEDENKRLHGLKELAAFLEISEPTARKLKNSGRIPFIQIGRKLIFNSNDVLVGVTHQTTN